MLVEAGFGPVGSSRFSHDRVCGLFAVYSRPCRDNSAGQRGTGNWASEGVREDRWGRAARQGGVRAR